MSTIPMDEQQCQQDTLQRVQNWLDLLERRILLMLEANDPQLMKPGEREQAIGRYLLLMVRLLQVRRQSALASPSSSEEALLNELLHEEE